MGAPRPSRRFYFDQVAGQPRAGFNFINLFIFERNFFQLFFPKFFLLIDINRLSLIQCHSYIPATIDILRPSSSIYRAFETSKGSFDIFVQTISHTHIWSVRRYQSIRCSFLNKIPTFLVIKSIIISPTEKLIYFALTRNFSRSTS